MNCPARPWPRQLSTIERGNGCSATAQNHDAVLSPVITRDGLTSEFHAFDETRWGVLKPRNLSAHGNHDYHVVGAPPGRLLSAARAALQRRVVNGVLLLALESCVPSSDLRLCSGLVVRARVELNRTTPSPPCRRETLHPTRGRSTRPPGGLQCRLDGEVLPHLRTGRAPRSVLLGTRLVRLHRRGPLMQ